MYVHADKCNLTFLFCSRCFEILWSAYGISVHSVAYFILYKSKAAEMCSNLSTYLWFAAAPQTSMMDFFQILYAFSSSVSLLRE